MRHAQLQFMPRCVFSQLIFINIRKTSTYRAQVKQIRIRSYMTIQRHTRPIRTMQVHTRLCKGKKTIHDQTWLHKTKYLRYQNIHYHTRPYRTKQDYTGTYRTTQDHTWTYWTIQDCTRRYWTIHDHKRQIKTIQEHRESWLQKDKKDHIGPHKTIPDHTGL